MMVCSTRERDTNNYTSTLSINGSTANMNVKLLQGNGSSAITADSTTIHILSSPSSATANTFGSSQLYFSNYSGSINKSFSIDSVSETNATESYQRISDILRSNTEAITGLTIGGGLAAGSTVSLYGIGGSGDGGPKATGGIIQKVGDYWVHTFRASGTFTPTTNLTDVEYLVIAGGGGGGIGNSQGGGGAGGYRSSVVGAASGGGASAEPRLSLSSGTSYTVTIGAGGAADSKGVDSVFGTITSIGGGGGKGTSDSRNNGGSGGGGREVSTTGGLGTTGQGYNGGIGASDGVSWAAGGGGGGAGAVGANATGAFPEISYGGAGGVGVSSSITGAAVFRAGGGGGAGGGGSNPNGGAGGNGGGGAGGFRTTPGTSGTANTGGGGGGYTTSGGSGIVIVRYAA